MVWKVGGQGIELVTGIDQEALRVREGGSLALGVRRTLVPPSPVFVGTAVVVAEASELDSVLSESASTAVD